MTGHADVVRKGGTWIPPVYKGKFDAALDALVAERDEARLMLDEQWQANQRLAQDHYFARAEAAEMERDEAKGLLADLLTRSKELLARTEAAEARVAELEKALDDAIACLQRVVEADRDDSRMGHPNAGDSCIGVCIALDVMPWLDQRGKLLPFVARAALAGEGDDRDS